MLTLHSIKRDIAHLCRDVTPPASAPKQEQQDQQQPQEQQQLEPAAPPAQPMLPEASQSQPQLYDAGSSSWPLLPDANGAGAHDTLDLGAMARSGSGLSGDGWGVHTNAEFGILS